MKATEQCLPVVLSLLLYAVFQTFAVLKLKSLIV